MKHAHVDVSQRRIATPHPSCACLEVLVGSGLVKGQGLALLHQHHAAQLDAQVVLHGAQTRHGNTQVNRGGGHTQTRIAAPTLTSTQGLVASHLVKVDPRVAGRGGQAAPVGVVPEDGGLGQVGACHAAGNL